MTDRDPRFTGIAVLLTGAASGIGRAVALRLASEGADVFGVDIDADGLAETVALASDSAGSISTHVADLTDPAVCAATVNAAVEQLGHLDVLGNVAGIARGEHFTDVTVEQYRRMMAINTDAPFFLSQAAIPHLLASPTGGNIVNVASNAGLMGQAYTATYCMSKGAVVQLTRSLAMEYVKTGLRVNALAPAGVDTPLARNFSIPADIDGSLMAAYVGFRPPGSAEDVAAMFAHLISDECGSVHGAVVSMDGGVTAG